MLWNEVIELVKETARTNEMGDPVTKLTYRIVYADKKGVRQSEFYQANAIGLKPELMYVINEHDYEGERLIRVDKKLLYDIIRTYPAKNEGLELVCSRVVNKNANA